MKIKVENVGNGLLAIHDFFTQNGIAKKVEFEQTNQHGEVFIDIPGDIVVLLQSKGLLNQFAKAISGK